MIGNFNGDYITQPGINPEVPGGITEEVNGLLAESYAVTTRANYTSKMTKFIAFAAQYRLVETAYNGADPVLPDITPMLLMFFAACLVREGVKRVGSITGYCSAVKQWCLIHDRPDPTINPRTGALDIRYLRLHRAIKRRLGTKATQREPLSVRALARILRALRSGFIVHTAMINDFVAAILLGFYAMLRVSEFTNKLVGTHDLIKEACRGDITFFGPTERPNGFRFVVKCSKTDQFRTTQTLHVYKTPDAALCPVRAMHKLFQNDPRPPGTPLFDFTTRTANTPGRPMSAARSRFITGFQRALRMCNLSTAKVQTHSLRSGGATAYLQAGIDPYIIQRMGRWRSWCWMIYTWASTSHIQHAMESISACDRNARPVNLDEVRW